MSEHLFPRQWLDLWETVLCIFRVHCKNFLSRGRAQYFDDLYKLIDAALSGEDGLAEHELSNNATNGPYINIGAVV